MTSRSGEQTGRGRGKPGLAAEKKKSGNSGGENGKGKTLPHFKEKELT